MFCLFVALPPRGGDGGGEGSAAAGQSAPGRGRARIPGLGRRSGRGGGTLMSLLVPSLPAGETFGLLAEFGSPKDLYHACEKVRDAGYKRWDAHSSLPGPWPRRSHGSRPLAAPLRDAFLWSVRARSAASRCRFGRTVSRTRSSSAASRFFNWQPYVPDHLRAAAYCSRHSRTVVGMLAFNKLPMLFHPLFGVDARSRA